MQTSTLTWRTLPTIWLVSIHCFWALTRMGALQQHCALRCSVLNPLIHQIVTPTKSINPLKSVAMGFPATGLEGYFRNHIEDTANYLKWRHNDKFLVRHQAGKWRTKGEGWSVRPKGQTTKGEGQRARQKVNGEGRSVRAKGRKVKGEGRKGRMKDWRWRSEGRG